MIQIYTQSKPDISKNGIIINPISCVINPKLNGENELEMEFAIDDGLYKYIQINNFIAVSTPDFDNIQLYRIYDTKKSMSNYSIIAYARHIQFDLSKNVIFNKSLSICNGQQAIDSILENTEFTGHSDITLQDTMQYKLRNVQNIINGSEDDSFINVWGGEISCNNYDITINTKRGSDKGIRVTFGYNLEDIEEEITFDDVITRLYPYSGDLVLSSNTPYVDSPLISSIGVLEECIEFSDVKVKENSDDEEGFDTREEAEAEMVRRCTKLFEKGLDKITANYIVKMQDLSKTTEYKTLGYDLLEKVCLGDTVHCYNKNIDIEVEARCISYKWDCVNEEYIEIELGEFISNYVNMQNNKIDNLYKTIEQTEQNILLEVDSLDNKLTSKIEVTAEEIRSEVTDADNNLQSQITQNAGKITAIVQYNTYTGSWELSESAFKVAFSGASDGYSEITGDGITIYDGRFKIKKNTDTVFYVNTSGRCTADGGFRVDDGSSTCKIDSYGISITNDNGYTGTLYVDSSSTTLTTDDDLEVYGTLRAQGTLRAYGYTHCYDDLDVDYDLYVDGSLDVSGEKNCLQDTQNYDKRRINAYETCEYFFGDVGEGIIKDGECIVYIDDIFSECVNTKVSYQVFTQCYSGNINKIERFENYFIIYGSENTEFAWELKAKRLGFENNRLEKVLKFEETNTKEIEDILLENDNSNLEDILLEEVV